MGIIKRYIEHRKNKEKRIKEQAELISKHNEILFRKFKPISNDLPEPVRDKIVYRVRSVFTPEMFEWLRKEGFYRYLRQLEFKITSGGIKRYIDGREIGQLSLDDWR